MSSTQALPARTAEVSRKTAETDITVSINLDGTGVSRLESGIGFLDHMLEQIARHGLIDLEVKARGDLHIDDHHTVEDVGIALGQCFRKALGDKAGISRYADVTLPLDEALSRVVVDISGRPYLVFRTAFHAPKIGSFDTQLVEEWFRAFAMQAGLTLHVETFYGSNDHHIAESCFKALARALRLAVAVDAAQGGRVPSTKGVLEA